MTQLKHLSADSAFYHTNIPSILWGVAGEGGMPFLLSRDGRKFINGEISTIKNGQFTGLDVEFEDAKNRHVFSTLDKATLTSYPACTPKTNVYVVSDIHCPYCRLFHQQIPALIAQGVGVHIIGYPIYEESKEPMRQLWCQPDNAKRAKLLSNAMQGTMPAKHCQGKENQLINNQKLAQPLAFVATPAIYREDGALFEGDFTGNEFLEFLAVNE